MKLPWIKFFPGDWLKDPKLSLCTHATRGIWMDLICAMHEDGQSGQLIGTLEQLARIARCLPSDMAIALAEIQRTGTGDVTLCNRNVTKKIAVFGGDVTEMYTVCNRRMKSEAKAREQTRKRVSKMRCNAAVTKQNEPCNASVTPYARARASDYLSQKSEVRDQKLKLEADKEDADKGDKAFKKLTDREKHLAAVFEKALSGQWVNDSGKWINRIKTDFEKCERVLAEVRSGMIEERIKTTAAQYAEQIWKEFA